MGLLGCPSSSPPQDTSSSQKGDAVNSQGQLSPIWQQTEYIFYNKTGGQVTVIYVGQGKLRKKDGSVVEKPDGSTRGEDGIIRDYILNEDGEQEYVTREYKEISVQLEDGECVFTNYYYVLNLKIQGKIICDSSRHGKPDPQRPCFDEVNQVRNGKGWRNTEQRGKGPFSYVEFYNIVNRSDLFEAAKEPEELDNSFTHSCEMLVPDDYKPWSERMNDIGIEGDGPVIDNPGGGDQPIQQGG